MDFFIQRLILDRKKLENGHHFFLEIFEIYMIFVQLSDPLVLFYRTDLNSCTVSSNKFYRIKEHFIWSIKIIIKKVTLAWATKIRQRPFSPIFFHIHSHLLYYSLIVYSKNIFVINFHRLKVP